MTPDPATPGEIPPALLRDAAADFTPSAPAPPAGDDDPDVHLRDSVLAKEFFDRAVAEAAGGDEEDAVAHFLRASKLAEAAREWYLAALACHRLGDLFLTPAPPYDLDRAFRMYRRAVVAYEQCGHFEEARFLSYLVTREKLRHACELRLPWRLRAELALFWAVAGFGYRPFRVVGTAAVIVLAYAVAYWAAGGVRDAGTREPAGFPACVYFSGVTFSTVGAGDLVVAPHARGLVLSEGLLGAFAMSFFVVVLANRLRH